MTDNALKLQFSDQTFIERLLEWYQVNRRDLPWRDTSDPYHVWLSEVMLQQTQVKTVIPYFNRFVKAYPKLEDLADADETRILDLWSGLGYYSRARNICKAARQIKDLHQGEFPEDYEKIIALPGIGRYTAGAVLSIAFSKPYPILDGNIRRLMLRLLGIRYEIDGKLISKLWNLLSSLVQKVSDFGSIADFNQALMELGALICFPRSPQCPRCPFQDCCEALSLGLQTVIPQIRKPKRTEKLNFVSFLIRSGKRFLMRKNSGQAFLKDFWEFPKVEGDPFDPNIAEKCQKTLGISVHLDTRLEPVQHQITFRKMTFFPWIVSLKGQLDETADLKWLDPDDPGYPKSSYIQKILDNLAGI